MSTRCGRDAATADGGAAMRDSADAGGTPALLGSVGRDLVLRVQTAALGRLMGRGALGVAAVADAAGRPVRTVKGWRAGEAVMPVDALLDLTAVLGPELPDAFLRIVGYGGVHAVGDADGDPHRAAAALAARLHGLAARLADGRFCHRDKAATAPEIRCLVRELEAFLAGMEEGR